MRIYRRMRPDGTEAPVYQVAFTVPGGRPVIESTHQTELRAAKAAAASIYQRALAEVQRDIRTSSSQDAVVFEDRDIIMRYETEGVGRQDRGAVARWLRARVHETTRTGRPLALATFDIDGQNLRYLASAVDPATGAPFFAGRPIKEITGEQVTGFVAWSKAEGLVVETIAKRLTTLRKILVHLHGTPGADGLPLLGMMPLIPYLGTSRDADGWGRALSRMEWAALRAALPGTLKSAQGVWRAPRGKTWYASHEGKNVNLGTEDEEEAHRRAQALTRGSREVDQRGWAELCLWSAMHPADVNSFGAERIGGHPGSLPGLAAGTFMWRNTKNRGHRVRDEPRRMPADMQATVERLRRERGGWEIPGRPIAGYWKNHHRDLNLAARRAGIEPIADDRGGTHLVSASDLRRTAATWLGEGLIVRGSGPDKSAIEVIADFLGHRGLDVARRIYDRAKGPRSELAAEVLSGFACAPQSAARTTAAVLPLHKKGGR